jgi:hypothetical protein
MPSDPAFEIGLGPALQSRPWGNGQPHLHLG